MDISVGNSELAELAVALKHRNSKIIPPNLKPTLKSLFDTVVDCADRICRRQSGLAARDA
jgi:hypothetical protein